MSDFIQFLSDIGHYVGAGLVGISDKYLGTNFQERVMQRNQFDFNAQQAQIDRQWQEQMQDKMNMYNSPEQQMQRLRAAGLNPSLANGQPVAEAAQPSAGAAASGSSGAGGRGSGNLVHDLLSIKMLDSQIRDLDASAALKEEQAETDRRLRQYRIDNLYAETQHIWSKMDLIAEEIQSKIKGRELTDAEIDKIRFDKLMADRKFTIDWQRLQNETKLTDAEIEKIKADTEKALADARVTRREYDEMIWTFTMRSLGLEKQVNLTEAQISQAKATARKLGMDADALEPEAYKGRHTMDTIMGKGGKAKQILGCARFAMSTLAQDIGPVFGAFVKL